MEKISPEEYRKILEGLELIDIVLSSIKAEIKHDMLSEGMKISIKDSAEYELTENDEFVVKDRYVLTAKNTKNKTALKIEAVYVLVFETKLKITDDFFEIYKETSLPLNVWPFFRELVNSITGRMNIPPLTLPLLKR